MPYTADIATNYASSTMAGGNGGRGTALQPTDTTLYLATGQGALFPQPANGSTFRIQIGTSEIAICTGRATDTLTITRGAEGTTAITAPVGTTVQLAITAASFSDLWTALNSGRLFIVTDNAYGAKGDGVTDDTSAIQAAITACQNAGSGIVFLPPTSNYYLISSTLNVTSDNVQIVGAGWASQIQAKTTFSGSYMIYVQGGGGFRYGFKMQDIFLNCNSVSGLGGINLESTYHCVLDHVRVRYMGGVGIHVNGIGGKFGAYNTIHDCTVTDGVGATAMGLNTNNSEWLTISDCSFVTFTTAGQYGVNINNLNCSVVGCRFDNCDTALWLSFASRNVVTGCQFDRGYTRFINLRGCQGTVISNCSFNTRSGTGTEMIYVNDPNNQGNSIINCAVEPQTTWTNFVNESGNTGGPGNIYAGNAVCNLKIVCVTGKAANNPQLNPLQQLHTPTAAPTLSAVGSGGTLTAGTYQVEITYVNAFGETAPTTASSQAISGTQNLQINAPPQMGNAYGWYAYVTQAGGAIFTRQQAAGAPSQFGKNLILAANPTSTGANPPGANTTAGFAQPAVPSSTTAYRNAFGVDCTVYIAGGTVTAIIVGNTATGLTSGAFRVPAYQTISITYSVAPTWVWYGE